MPYASAFKIMSNRTARERFWPIRSSCRALVFVGVRLFVGSVPTFAGAVVLRTTAFFLSRLVQGRALRYAVIVAFPDNVGVGREGEQSLDRLAMSVVVSDLSHQVSGLVAVITETHSLPNEAYR